MSEKHCGQVKAHMNGHTVEKPVYCAGWMGALYCKQKGYLHGTLYANGKLGEIYSWTDLVLFEEWVRVEIKPKRTIIVRHLVETTKQRILGKVR